jgi:hypothetical protein
VSTCHGCGQGQILGLCTGMCQPTLPFSPRESIEDFVEEWAAGRQEVVDMVACAVADSLRLLADLVIADDTKEDVVEMLRDRANELNGGAS